MKETGIFYVPDDPYVDAGENHEVAADLIKGGHIRRRPDLTVRSFPSGTRNCYAAHGRGEQVPGPGGGRLWQLRRQERLLRVTVRPAPGDELLGHRAAGRWEAGVRGVVRGVGELGAVCLVNTGQGTPFVSSVELRPLGSELYLPVMANQSIRLYRRHNLGPTTAHITRIKETSSTPAHRSNMPCCPRACLTFTQRDEVELKLCIRRRLVELEFLIPKQLEFHRRARIWRRWSYGAPGGGRRGGPLSSCSPAVGAEGKAGDL
uniref:Malectin-like domain-containing protein n=1 Tax=Oryza glumipatula TaxID=40148 RepID=A0A0E0B1X7_9ORYZ